MKLKLALSYRTFYVIVPGLPSGNVPEGGRVRSQVLVRRYLIVQILFARRLKSVSN